MHCFAHIQTANDCRCLAKEKNNHERKKAATNGIDNDLRENAQQNKEHRAEKLVLYAKLRKETKRKKRSSNDTNNQEEKEEMMK